MLKNLLMKFTTRRIKKMNKLLLTGILSLGLPLVVHAKDPNVKANCNLNWKQSNPGWTSIPSQHGITIINKTPTELVYDVYFDNAIQYPKAREMPLDYSEAPYRPNAHQEYHFKIKPGQTMYYGEISIEKVAGFPHKGRYRTRATTHIMYNGAVLGDCVYYNSIEIN